jgi:UDPglucose 6-dehydrogenase
LAVLNAVEDANDRQKLVLVKKIIQAFGENLSGKRFAIWGLAFKPNTDDMREAPSRIIISELVKRGASIAAYDPVAMTEAKRVIPEPIDYVDQPMQALSNADALVIVTEWKEFRSPDFEEIARQLKTPQIFDGRNMYEPSVVKRAGLTYQGIGRRST